jgi:hypothetical protein
MHLPLWLTHLYQSTIVHHALSEAKKDHVNPTIFLTIYALHYLIVWPAFAWIIVTYRRKKNITNIVTFWIFSMLIPWFYPLFFGRLPWYLYVGLIGLMAFIVWHGYHTIQKRLAVEKAKTALDERTVKEVA